MKRVDIISKGTHKILESREDSNFVLSENSVVIINTPIKAIKKIERIGNDLVIHFSKTDEPLIIKNYYNDNNNADNSLVLKTEDGRLLWIQDLENAGVIDKAINYQVIDDVELLLYQEDSPYMAALPWLTGGILIAALAYGNREKNGAPKEDKPIFKDPVAINAYEDNVGSKTGTFGILKPTDDTTPGFVIGTLGDDRTPVLYVDGKEVASVYDRENGILTPVEPLSEGSHLIAYKEVDGKGNEGDLGEAAEIIIDTTAPNQPDTPTEYIDDAGEKTGHFDFTVSTDDTTPTIVIGDIPADETPTLYVDGRPVESIYDAENGTLTPKTPLSEGTHEISFTLTDEAGNESFQSDPVTIDIVTTAPNQPSTPTSYVDDIGNNQGQFNFSVPTDDTKPGIVIGVLDNGIAPNLYVDGKEVAAIYDPATGTLTPTVALAEGTHSITYTLTDVAGNESVPSNPVVLVVDTTAPTKIELDSVIDDVEYLTGKLESGNYTNDTQPTFNGHGAEAGALISLKDETGKVIGTAIADAKGQWSVEPSAANKLSDGAHNLIVTQTDTAGNESAATSFELNVDTKAPTQKTEITDVYDDEGVKTGKVKDNGYTDDTTPRINGTISAELGSNEKVVVYRDGKYIGEATVKGTSWYFDDKDLENGKAYQYTARVEDLAGNRGGDSNSYNINIDTDAPPQTITILSMHDNYGPVQGDFASGVTTDDSTPTLNGTLSSALAANEYIVIYRNGERIDSVTVQAGVTQWEYTDGGLSNGQTYTYTAKVEDASGLQSASSNPFELKYASDGSFNKGEVIGIYDDVAPNIGNVPNNGYTNDTSPLLQGTLNSALSAGETIAIYRGGVKIGEAVLDPSDPTGKSWTYQDKDLKDGTKYKYSVAVESAAGVAGAESTTYTINIDTTPPDQKITIEEIYDNKDPVIGKVGDGGVTNDDTPEIRGSLNSGLAAGELIYIYRDGECRGSTTATYSNGKWSWSYTDSSLGSNETYTYTAKVVDLAGNSSSLSNSYSITTNFDDVGQSAQIIRILDDVEPGVDPVPNNGYTNDKTPTLEGSITSPLSAGDIVVIYRNGDEIGTATMTSSTTWKYEATLDADGFYTYIAAVRNNVGKDGAPSNSYSINLDTVPPTATAQIYSYTDDVAPQLGDYRSGTYTNDTTPTLNISIKGVLGANEVVAVYRDGAKVGEAILVNGIYRFEDKALADGKTYTYTVRVEDAAGNQGTVSDQFIINIDTTAPTKIELDSVVDDVEYLTGKLESGNYTNDTQPTFNGHGAEAGALISLKDETGKVIGTAIADAKGQWSVEPSAANKLSDGAHNLIVTQTDTAGNESAATSFELNVDTKAPTQKTEITDVYDDEGVKTGKVKDNGYTDDTTPRINGTISAELGSNEKVVVYRDGKYIGEATVKGTSWYFDDKDLENGKAYQYTARVEDLAGNRGGDSNSYNINIDTDAPPQTITILSMHDNYGPVQGDFASGVTTDDSTPTLNGTLSSALAANEYIVIYRNGERIDSVTVQAGVTQWEYTDGGLSNGQTYTYTAKVEDASGLQSASSNPFELKYASDGSFNKGEVIGIYDDVAPNIGNVPNNGYTNDTSPLLQGTLNSALSAGETIAIYRGGVKIGEAVLDPSDPTGKSWTYQDKDLKDGTKYKYSVAVESAAGVAGAESTTYTINIDTTPPDQKITIEEIYDNKDPVIGKVGDGGVTNDDTPEIRGSLNSGLAAGELIYIYRDGECRGSTTATYSNGKWSWSYTDSSLGSNETYTYTAKVVDLAGNSSSLSNSYSITTNFDDVGQSAQIIRILDDVEPGVDPVPNNGYTNDKTPTLEGSITSPLSAGDIVVIYRNGDEIGTATMTSSTTWKYEATLDADGFYTYVAAVRNNVGKDGAPSNSYSINLDTVPPTATAQIYSYTDDVAPQLGDYGSGTYTNDTTPTLNISIKGVLGANEVVAVYRDGAKVGEAILVNGIYRFEDKALADGKTYTYTVRVEDAAGNQGIVSDQFIINIDTTPPLKPISAITQYDDDVGAKVGILPISTPTDDTKPGFVIDKLASDQQAYLYVDNVKVDAIYDPVKGTLTPVTELATGDHVIQYSVVDSAGNEGQKSDPATIQIALSNTITPATPTQYIDDVDPVQGIFGTGTTTNDTTPSVIITPISSNEKATLYVDGKEVESVYDPVKGTLTPKTPLQDGDYKVTYTVTDVVGNESPQSGPINIIVDTVVPVTPTTPTQYLDNVDPVQGLFGTGTSTNDQTPGIMIGQKDSNLTASLYVDGKAVESVYDAASGTLTPKTPLVDGNYNFSYSLTDTAGNESAQSGAINISIDTTPPLKPISAITQYDDDVGAKVGILPISTPTDDTKPGFVIDKLASDQQAYLYVDNVKVDAIYDPVKGTLTPVTELATGDHVIQYSVVDSAGNEGQKSDPATIQIALSNTITPATPTQYIDDVDPVQGIFGTGTTTNDTTPSVIITPISSNEKATLYVDGKEVESVYDPVKGTLTPKTPLQDGDYKVTYTVTDVVGNESPQSGPINIIVDTVVPVTPTTPTQYLDNVDPVQGLFGTGTSTNDQTPGIMIGQKDSNLTASLYVDGKAVESVYDAASGTLTPKTPLVDGNYNFSYSLTDTAGNESAQSGAINISIDTTPPLKPISAITQYDDDVGAKVGILPISTPTDDTKPGFVIDKLASDQQAYLYVDNVKVDAIYDPVKGTLTPVTELATGDHVIQYSVVDSAGNEGQKSDPATIQIALSNTITPATPTQYIDDVDPVQGIFGTGTTTNDTTPSVIITPISSNEKATLYVDGKEVESVYDPVKGTLTPKTPLQDGDYKVTYTVTDVVGNESPQSGPINIIVDTVVPVTPTTPTQYLDNVDPVQGLFGTGTSTNDQTPGIMIGQKDSNLTASLYVDGKAVESVYDAASGTLTPKTPLVDGNYNFSYSLTDTAGNESAQSGAINISIDTTPPLKPISAITQYDDDVGAKVGILPISTPTDDTKPGFVIDKLASDQQAYLYVDNVKVDAIYDPVKGTLTPVTELATGDHVIQYSVVDSAGNEGQKSDPATIQIALSNTITPATPTQYIDDVDPVQGIFGTGTTTNDTTPSVIITPISSNEKATLYVDGKEVESVYDPVKGTLTPKTPLQDGDYKVTYTVTDVVGNESPQSGPINIIVDTVVPVTPTTPTQYLDNVDPVQGLFGTGTSTNDQTPGIMIGQKDSNLTASLYVDGKAVESVYDAASGTLTPKTPLVDGNYNFSYSLTDTAGNESAQSGAINISIDTTPPLKPISAITQYDDDVGAKVGILPISTPTDDTKPGFVIDKLASDQQAYLYVDNVKVDAIYDPVKGTLTPVKELATGDHVIQYSVVDNAGNEGLKSDPATIQIALSNTITPATPTQYIDDVDPVQGIFGTGTTTNDTTPSIIITPISSDEKATLYVGGKEVESVYDPVKGTLTPKTPLQDGDYKVTYTVTDIVGNESPQSGPINIIVDTVVPVAPKTPTQYLDNVDPVQGLFGTGTSTNDQTPGIMIGQKDSNLTASLYVDGKAVESVYDAASGTLTPKTPLVDGNYNFSYSLTDTAGNESAQSGAINISIDTTPPLKPISAITQYDDDVGAKVGILPISTPTDDTKPGFVIDKLASDQQAYLYVDNVKVDAIYDPVKGTLTPVKELATGDHVIQYSVVDNAGNEGLKSDPATIQIALSNTITPATPTQYIDDVDPVQGIFGTGTTTNDTTPSIIITPISSDEKATLYVGGKEVESVYDPVKGTLTPKTPLQDGDYKVTYTVTDIVGNESPQSGPINIIVDTVVPVAPKTPTQYLDNVDPVQGLFGTGTSTNDQTPGIMIGQKDSNLTASLYVDGKAVESVYDAASGTLTPKTPLVDGNYNFSYSLTDTAGNESAQSGAINITIDTIAPAQPDSPTQYIDDVNPQTGIFENDSSTNDTRPGFIIGELKEDETPTLYVDGKPVDAIYDPVTGTLTPKNPLSEGSHDITYSVTDVAGNESLQSNPDQPLTVVIDTIAPAALTIESYTDNRGENDAFGIYDLGIFPINKPTNDTTPTLNGSGAEAGALVTLKDESGNILGTSIADTGGFWSVTPTVPFELGDYLKTLYVTESDHAGNESLATSCTLHIDTSSPKPSIVVSAIIDDAGEKVSQFTITKDTTPTLVGTLNFEVQAGEKICILREGVIVGFTEANGTSWTFTDNTIDVSLYLGTNKSFSYRAYVIDEAGNVSGQSRDYNIIIDMKTISRNLIDTLSEPIIDETLNNSNSELSNSTALQNVENNVDNSDINLTVTPLTLNLKRTLLVGDTMADSKAALFGLDISNSLDQKTVNDENTTDASVEIIARNLKAQIIKITEIYDNKGPSVGVVADGGTTNDDTPEIRGTITAPLADGEMIIISCNNEEVGMAIVTGNTWTYTDASLGNYATYQYTATIKNSEGEILYVSNPYTMTTDFDDRGSDIMIIRLKDDVDPIEGYISNNGVTNDETPTLEGSYGVTLAVGDVIAIYRDNVEVGFADINETTKTWSFTDDLSQVSDGYHNYTAVVRSGDKETKSSEFKINFDTTPPTVIAVISDYYDDVAPQTGNFLNNSITNDTSPTLNINVSDALATDEVVQVFKDGGYIGNATKVDSFHYKFEDTGLVDGKTYTYTTLVVDAAGNKGQMSDDFNITVDLVAPDQPNAPTHYYDDVGSIQGVFGTDTTTDDTKPAIIIEQIESNESATLYVDGVKVDSVYDSVSSTLTPVIPLENGKYDISYTISDAAGNESYKSDVIVITVNTTAPTQPTAPTEYVDNVDPVQGTFASGTTTNDTTPSVIVGTLPADEKPTLYVDGKPVDSIYDPATGTLTPVTPLTEGDHDLSYTLTDIAGNESLPSDPIQVLVDTKAPTQPTAPTEFVDNVGSKQGDFPTGTTTDDTTPSVIVGVLPADEKPTLYVDGKQVGSVYDPVTGTLTPVTPLAEGDHDLSYTLTDIAGNESLPSDPIQVIVDTKAPTQPTAPTEYVDNVDPVQGTFASGTTTNDTTPSVIVGTLPVDEKPTLYVDGKPVDSIYDPVAGTLTPVNPMSEGDHDLSYTLTDIAGNESLPSDPIQVIVDTKAPTQPTAPTEFVDNVGSIQGDFASGSATDDTTPSVIVGTLPADEKPTLYVDGKQVGSVYDPVAGTLTPVNPIGEGNHDLSYTLTDIAGNESLPSDPIQVIVDTKAPTQPTAPTEFVDNVGSKQGDFTTGTTTDDTTPSVIVGALPADEKPTLYVDGKPVDSVYDPVAGTLTPVNPMSEGDHAISYTLTDVAGNESAASDPILVKVDTTAPTALINIKTYADDVGPITGEFNKNTKTDDTAPVLNIKVNGTINADEVVQIYRDGKYIGDATLVKGNNYQFEDSGLVDGKTYNYTARVVDAAGNYGEFNGNFKITIDTTAPNQPNAPTVYIDNVDPIQGTFASGDITNDTTPSIIIGALNADEIPNLYVDGQKVDSIYDATTNTLTPVNPLDEGTHHMSYSLSDETGNESAPSDPIVIIVDITPPDQPATPTEYIDDVGIFQGHLGTGTSTDDTTPSVIVGILPADEKPTLYVDGKAVDAIYDPVAGTLTPVLPLVEGDHALSYTLTDIAGNESLPSGAINIQIDTTKPIIDDLSTSFKLSVDTADGVAVGYTSTITATNNDLITRDNTLGQISGVLNRSLVQGEMLQISKDGGLTWEDVSSIQGANWTYQDNDVHAVDATVEFSFRVRDDVGNYTYLAGQEKSVQIDLTGPNGISLKPNVASQIVSGVKYTFTSAEYGLAEPGTKIALVNDVNNNGMWQEGIDTVVSYATVDANGQWSITTNIPKGDQNLAFLVWDKAGNVSTLSPITHVTSDDKVTPPTTGGPGAEVIVTKWGGTTDGDGYGVNCAAVTVNADGTYSFWQSVRGTTNSTCTTTANAGRVYSGVDLENYSAAYLAQASKANGAGYNLDNCCYGQFVSSAVFADINRDGNADVMSQLSSYGNCGYTAYWMNNGDGTYSSKALNQGVLNHLGGVIAYDRTGDGYLDFVIADSCSDSITFIKNNAGNLTYETSTVTCSGNGMPQSAAMTIYNGLKTGSITGTAMPKDLSILHDVAGVDLDNNGTIDIVAHVDYNGKVLYGDCSRGMGIMYNSGTSAGFTYVNQANVFTSDGGTDYGNLQQSIVFADYNGDGWLDMFISRGTKAGVDSNESRIYLNDGKGQLNATDSQALWFGDKLSGGSAFAIDWNLDGKQDLIEVPAQVTGCYIKTGFAPTLYLNYGNNVWGKDAYALTPSTYTDITGATAVDYNWDGSVDLLLYRAGSDAGVVSSTNSAPTILIKNTNVAADGTSLHVKILDGQGINSYYGNTVKLYDSKGNLVSTQVLNPQSSGSTDSTGIVNFYGLDPNETYSIQLLRISNGVADNVGGIDNLGGYANKTINSSWTGLIAGKANEAYVLLAESDTATNNSGSNASGVVGTGYNDHFYGSLGNDHYNGGGGWETGANGKQVWVANGGEDILDYSNLQGQISINVATGTVTKVINGIKTIDTFENIEQFVGAKGDTVFTGNDTNHVFVGGAGNDTFNLGSTASDTIYFNLLNPKDPTGGNGTDTVNGFHVGKVGTDQNADIIDIHELLDNYKGTAGLYTDVDSVKLDIASSGLKNYLQITDDGTNTYISVDLNGTGHNYATVLTLHDVKTDLETLLLNNQIVI